MGSLLGQPSPPDPSAGLTASYGAGQQQQNFNVAQQAGSMVNQSNPYGSLNYVQTGTGPGGVPIYTAQTKLSPIEQQLFNQYTGTQKQAGGQAGTLLGTGGYGSGASPSSVIGSATSGLTGQMLGNEINSLEPYFKMQRDQQDAQLQNQGFQPGTTAYDNARQPLLASQNTTISNFLAQAQPQAYQEAAQMYQMPLTMSEQLAQWGVPQTPNSSFVSTPGLGSVNSIGAYGTAQNAANQQYQAQQAQYNAMIQALGGIGAGALGFGLGGGFGALGGMLSGPSNGAGTQGMGGWV